MEIKQYDYDHLAKFYDIMELTGIDHEQLNDFLIKLFRHYKVENVLDFTAGTGAQAITLAKLGFKVTANDLNKSMLDIAKLKAKEKNLNIEFHEGNIINANYGEFDAVISMYNAIGHLSKEEFGKALRNIANNLKDNGIYVFDICNLDYMKNGGFIDHEFMDLALEKDDVKYVRFNNNKIDFDTGIFNINQTSYVQVNNEEPKEYKESFDLQIYGIDELSEIITGSGFEIMFKYGGYGYKFDKNDSASILMVVRKKDR